MSWIRLGRIAAFAAATMACVAHAQEWQPLGSVHDRTYVLNRSSVTPIDGGFALGIFTDKAEGAEADELPNGKKYRSSFLNVEVKCSERAFRVARSRFFAGGKAQGGVVAEDEQPPGEGWAAAKPDTIGASFVAAACPG